MHDAHIIAWHRARMFQDMGEVSGHAFETLRTKAQARLADWLERGTYIGWVASPADRPEIIVGGAGVQLQPILPRPLSTSAIGEGRQGTIVNVFTETEWRRRGVAAQLLEEIIEWSRKECLDRLVLHASEEGRTLYDRLGFAPSNEMRFVASTTLSPSPTATLAFPIPSSAGTAPTTSPGVSPRH